MRNLRAFFHRLAEFWKKDRRELELQEEMNSLLEMECAAGVADGMTPEEARRTALMRINPESTKEQYRLQRGLPLLESLIQDLRFGLRMLRKNPGFAVVALLTVAIGIGANTVMFSAVNAVLLRGLPFHDPDRLVMVWEKNPAVEGFLAERLPVKLESYLYWRDQSQSFQGMSAALFNAINVSGFEKPERVEAASVSSNFFSVFGVSPALGRTFTPDETNGGTARVAIISYGLYQRQFGGSPDVLKHSIKLDGVENRIVGVLPRDFHMTAMWGGFDQPKPEVWMPLNTSSSQGLEQLQQNVLMVYARLKPGISLQQARNEMELLESRLVKQFPKAYDKFSATIYSLYAEDVAADLRRSLLVLQLAVGFVLLIACVNVANLLLARAAARGREITVRLALGASRGRLIRQMLVESMLFSALGACAGLLLAWLGIRAVVKLGPEDIRGLHELSLAPSVLLFTVLVSVAAGLLFGLAPAFYAVRQYFADRGAARSGQGGISRRVRAGLVIAEIALTIAPLIGAGLMIRTLHALTSLDLGIRPQNVFDAGLSLPETRYKTPQEFAAFCEQLLSRMKGLPEVEAVALAGSPPMQSIGYASFHLEGESADREQTVDYQPVSDGYLATMGAPLLKGRDFTPEEAEKEAGVMIVTQSVAQHLWPGQDPIGKAMVFGNNRPVKRVVIGVIPDTRILVISPEAHQGVYYPMRHFRTMTLIVRGRNGIAGLESAMRQQVHSLDADLPLYEVHPLTEVVRDSLAQQRFTMFLLMVFASLALVLAAIGLYGVLAYTVAQRTREIGIRMALGARSFDLLKMVLRQGLLLVGIGVAIGLSASLLLTGAMAGLLFGVRAHDPATFVLVAVVLALAALLACFIPARRAAKVDPMVALRCE
jgi:putative ABC transport system permease protein